MEDQENQTTEHDKDNYNRLMIVDTDKSYADTITVENDDLKNEGRITNEITMTLPNLEAIPHLRSSTSLLSMISNNENLDERSFKDGIDLSKSYCERERERGENIKF